MSPESDRYDVIIIGAGPGGMSAALTAARGGAATLLVDEQSSPGGQIYRSITEPGNAHHARLGADYLRGQELVASLEQSGVHHLRGAAVWQVSRQHEVSLSTEQGSRLITGRKLIIATGAQERPFPFPGWTLPGVMTCGAGQILLKSAGLVPGVPVILAGSGPLLFLLAWQYLQTGVSIDAILDTTPARNYLRAVKHAGSAVRGWPYLAKGLRYITLLVRAKVPIVAAVSKLRAAADSKGHLREIRYHRRGVEQSRACSLLLIHQGVVPNIQLTRSLDLAHEWEPLQHYWRPKRDQWGETEAEGIFIAGDGAGINGARAAEHHGQLAALKALFQLDRISLQELEQRGTEQRRAAKPHLAVRPFLDTLYTPADEVLAPDDDTLVCRCEEVTAGQVRGFVDQGCLGPQQTKAFSRSGMGPCQGRICGLTVSEIIARARGLTPDAVGYYHIRPPIKPVSLGELATLVDNKAASHA